MPRKYHWSAIAISCLSLMGVGIVVLVMGTGSTPPKQADVTTTCLNATVSTYHVARDQMHPLYFSEPSSCYALSPKAYQDVVSQAESIVDTGYDQ